MSSNVESVAVGVTGASGVLYAVRTIALGDAYCKKNLACI